MKQTKVKYTEKLILHVSRGQNLIFSTGCNLTMTILLYQILSVKPDQADTYKCFATNEYGKAVCTATLSVIEGKKNQKKINMFIVN